MPPRSSPSASIFEIEVRLRDIEPAVWRRLLVPASIRLGALHSVLNETMGWTNSHLHSFKLDERSFGDPRLDPDGELDLEDERKVKLDSLIAVGGTIVYEYDFGDSWEHDVRVLRQRERDDRLHYPLCVAGARACPPEDCGGVHGYELLLQSLRDKKHPEHDESMTWVGGLFDPEGFDVNRTNHALHMLRSKENGHLMPIANSSRLKHKNSKRTWSFCPWAPGAGLEPATIRLTGPSERAADEKAPENKASDVPTEQFGRLGAPWNALRDTEGDIADRAWTSWDGEPDVPPERRLMVARETDGQLHQLALLAQRVLDGSATAGDVSELRRLVDNVLRPGEPADPARPGERRPS